MVGERESLYRPHEDGFSGVRRIVPCTNLNIDILKSHVIQAQRHTVDMLQISFKPQRSRMRAPCEPRHASQDASKYLQSAHNTVGLASS